MPTTRSKAKTRRPSRLEATAHHEAGHAVAAYLRNRRFTSVSIVSGGETLGQCVFGRKPREIHLDVESYGKTRERIETLIMVAMAGVIAEYLLTGRRNWRGAQSDLHDATNCAAYVVSDEREMRAYLRWLWERTRNLLSAEPHWSAVKALAAELLAGGRVGERRARQVIAAALSRRPAVKRRRPAASRPTRRRRTR